MQNATTVKLGFDWGPRGSKVARALQQIRLVVVHRIEVSQEDSSFADTPHDIRRFFAEHPIGKAATGGAMPYPVIIDALGDVTQCLPLRDITPHARGHNPHAIALALTGDFRQRPPAPRQWASLVWVAAYVLELTALGEDALVGHDGLAEGSHDPQKQCPGVHLPMPALREQVRARRGTYATALDMVW